MFITWQIWHLTEPLIEGIENINGITGFRRIIFSNVTGHDCPYNEVFQRVVLYHISC